jgi:hypothetical protein
MKRLWKTLIAATALAAFAITAQASSHREALAILNEPCADNTDTYAWVQNGSHDKLYLIMNFNPCTSRVRATRAARVQRLPLRVSISASARASSRR